MVKTGPFTSKCKGNRVIALKCKYYFARRLTEPMAALTTEVTSVVRAAIGSVNFLAK